MTCGLAARLALVATNPKVIRGYSTLRWSSRSGKPLFELLHRDEHDDTARPLPPPAGQEALCEGDETFLPNRLDRAILHTMPEVAATAAQSVTASRIQASCSTTHKHAFVKLPPSLGVDWLSHHPGLDDIDRIAHTRGHKA